MSSPAWVRENVDSVLAVLVAVALLDIGGGLSRALTGQGAIATVAVVGVFGCAVGLVVLAASNVDVAAHGHAIAGIVLAVLAVAYVGVYLSLPQQFGTDAMLFTRAGVDAVLAGQNPYALDLTAAWEQYDTSIPGTMRVDGTLVGSYSYPAGMILAFVPQAALVGSALSLTSLVAMLSTTGVLIHESPGSLALAPIFATTLFRDMHFAAIGGIIDPVWVLPTLLAMVAYRRERYLWGALALGVAVAIKQQAWLIVPFAVVWLWADSDSRELAVRRIAASAVILGGVFAAVNLPFFLADPGAWVEGVFVALLGTTIVHMGVGPTLLSVTGVYPATALWYFGLLTFGGVVALIAYALYWPRLKWVAWVIPAVLLFLPHRSLPSYLTFVLPLAYYAALCSSGIDRRSAPGVSA